MRVCSLLELPIQIDQGPLDPVLEVFLNPTFNNLMSDMEKITNLMDKNFPKEPCNILYCEYNPEVSHISEIVELYPKCNPIHYNSQNKLYYEAATYIMHILSDHDNGGNWAAISELDPISAMETFLHYVDVTFGIKPTKPTTQISRQQLLWQK